MVETFSFAIKQNCGRIAREGARMQSQQSWHETYLGGSAEEERRIFVCLARDIQDVQLRNKKTSGASDIQRSFHAKCVVGVTNAKLSVLPNLPKQYQVEFFQPGRNFDATVRLSNANGAHRPDYK